MALLPFPWIEPGTERRLAPEVSDHKEDAHPALVGSRCRIRRERGGSDARQHSIQPVVGSAGGERGGGDVRAGGDRALRAAAPAPPRLLALRAARHGHARHDQAPLASPRPRRHALLPGGERATGALPRLRRASGGDSLRGRRGAAHARLRPAGRLAGAPDGSDTARPADAGQLANGRPHLRAGRAPTPAWRALPGPVPDRDRRGLLPARAPLPDARRRPRLGPHRLGLGGSAGEDEPGRLPGGARVRASAADRGRLAGHGFRLPHGGQTAAAASARLRRSLPRGQALQPRARSLPPHAVAPVPPGAGKARASAG